MKLPKAIVELSVLWIIGGLVFGVAIPTINMLTGCGPSWGSTQAKSLTDSLHASIQTIAVCNRDGGTCSAEDVRALARMNYCAVASVLNSQTGSVPVDAGIACQP